MPDIEQAIRERAYHLWVESGFEHGRAEAHWLAAQRDILRESLATIGRVTFSEKSETLAKSKRARRLKKQRAA
jgi:hypothetical protein